MMGLLQALALGAAVGVVFALFRFHPPAPGTWAGVMGIVGIVAAWQLTGMVMDRLVD